MRTPGISLRGCSRTGGNHCYFFFFGSFFRFVFAMSRNCFSDIDLTICFEAPLRLDFLRSPRWAASAAPAAICCFFDFAGIFLNRHPLRRRTYALEHPFGAATALVKALHKFKDEKRRKTPQIKDVFVPLRFHSRSSNRTCTCFHYELTEISFSGPKGDLQREAEFQVDQSQRHKSLSKRKLLDGHRVGCGIEPVWILWMLDESRHG